MSGASCTPMDLCHGWARVPIRLSATRKYMPWELRAKCKGATPPYWLRVEGKVIPVTSESALQLACHASAAYHDWLAYNAPEDDGFAEDMAERERRIQAHMDEPNSEDSEQGEE